ncbi:MAG: hypothetical protein ACI9K2_000741 [Myxococcota bacterium]|jgi:hypothetical protein
MRRVLWVALLVGCAPTPTRVPVDATVDSGSAPPAVDLPPQTTPSDPDGRCDHPPRIDWLSEPAGDPLADGDPVQLVNGHQGGWHIALNASVRGPRDLWMHPVITRADTGEQLAGEDNTLTVRLWAWDPSTCIGLLTGLQARIDEPTHMDRDAICALAGARLNLMLEVTDLESDASATASVQVVAIPDPDDDCP